MDINQALEAKVKVQFVKKEESVYNEQVQFYFYCNFFSQDGMAHPVRITVTQEQYAQKLQSGEYLDIDAEISSKWLRVIAKNITKASKG
jgi:plasmid rolling circle replication initiator protein Rep